MSPQLGLLKRNHVLFDFDDSTVSVKEVVADGTDDYKQKHVEHSHFDEPSLSGVVKLLARVGVVHFGGLTDQLQVVKNENKGGFDQNR